jgi:predicted transcriptional regulator of viral defense system
MRPAIKSALRVFEKNKVMRSAEIFEQGIQPRTLYQMRDDGLLIQEGRGLYRLVTDEIIWSDPDLAVVSLRIPKGVICLISALYFHQLTTQIPHEVYVALPKDSEKPRIQYPPTRFFWISPEPFKAGIEKHTIDNLEIKIYSAAKTIADCFKFRNKIGMDVALEALRDGLHNGRCTPSEIMHFALINRVARVILPYLEATMI